MCCHRRSYMKLSSLPRGMRQQLDTSRAFHSRSHSRRSLCRNHKTLLGRRRLQHCVDPTRSSDMFSGQNTIRCSTDTSGTSSCRYCIRSNIPEVSHRAGAASNSSRCWRRPRDRLNRRKRHLDRAQVVQPRSQNLHSALLQHYQLRLPLRTG
jgi:hypothetical protein